MSEAQTIKWREEWLTGAAGKIVRNVLAPHELDKDDRDRVLTTCIKVTCGWPHKGGVSLKRQRIGECWGFESSGGEVHEIFISPVLFEPVRVLDVLTHELLHAHFKRGVGHNKTFAAACTRIGLEGKATATRAGDDLREILTDIVDDMGPYPHSELRATAPLKKQTTRDRKVFCDNEECASLAVEGAKDGFKLRMTKVWMTELGVGRELDEDGLPDRVALQCPFCHRSMAVEQATGE